MPWRVFHGPRLVRELSLISLLVLREVEKWLRESQTWRDPTVWSKGVEYDGPVIPYAA